MHGRHAVVQPKIDRGRLRGGQARAPNQRRFRLLCVRWGLWKFKSSSSELTKEQIQISRKEDAAPFTASKEKSRGRGGQRSTLPIALSDPSSCQPFPFLASAAKLQHNEMFTNFRTSSKWEWYKKESTIYFPVDRGFTTLTTMCQR